MHTRNRCGFSAFDIDLDEIETINPTISFKVINNRIDRSHLNFNRQTVLTNFRHIRVVDNMAKRRLFKKLDNTVTITDSEMKRNYRVEPISLKVSLQYLNHARPCLDRNDRCLRAVRRENRRSYPDIGAHIKKNSPTIDTISRERLKEMGTEGFKRVVWPMLEARQVDVIGGNTFERELPTRNGKCDFAGGSHHSNIVLTAYDQEGDG